MTKNKIITLQPGDTFLVTGRYYNSTRRFRQVYSNYAYASGINLWNGRIWLLRNGKRTLLHTVTN